MSPPSDTPNGVPTAAAIYTRISKDRTGEELGVTRQEQDCRDLAETKGWTIASTYSDNDISAFDHRKTRPAYEQLLADIESGTIDGLIAYHSDRLYRQPKDLERLITLIESSRIPIAVVAEGDIDLTNATGRGMARVVGAFNRMQSERSAERIQRKHKELAQAGRPAGGVRAYGYEHDKLTIRESEAAIIREVAERVLAGEAVTTLTAELNERGIPTAQNKRWYPSSMLNLLRGPRIGGFRQHKGVLYPAAWPAILDAPTYEALQKRLEPKASHRRPSKYMLSGGLIICGLCGASMSGNRGGTRSPVYVCPPGKHGACGGGSRRAAAVEEWVLEQVFDRIDGPELAQSVSAPDDSEQLKIESELEDAERRLEVLASTWATGDLTEMEWRSARGELASKRERLLRLLHVKDRAEVRPDVLRAAWPDLNVQQRRAVLGEVIERIFVHPAKPSGRRFDPSSIEIVWRDQANKKGYGHD